MKYKITLFILFSFVSLNISSQTKDSIITLKGIEIHDSIQENAPYSIDYIVRKDILMNNDRDLGSLLKSSPNVSAVKKGGTNADPVVRGFKNSQLNIQIDNAIKVEGGCPNRMDPAAAHIEPENIESIEIIKGPHALRYGPSFGGVININTIQPEARDSFGISINAIAGFETNTNGKTAYLSLNGGGKSVFFLLTGNLKKYGDYGDGNDNNINSAFSKENYGAKLGIAPIKNHKIIFSYDNSFTKNTDFPALPMDERTDNSGIFSVNYNIKNISKKIKSLDLKYYNSVVEHEMDNKSRAFSDTVVAVSVLDAKNFGYKAEIMMLWKNNRLFVGTDHENISKDGDRIKKMIGQAPGPNGQVPEKIEQLWNSAEIRNFGLFAEYSKAIKTMKYVFAARLDKNTATSDVLELKNMMQANVYHNEDTDSDFHNFSFSLGATKSFNDNLSTGISLGRGSRSPDMVERFIILLPIGYDNYDYLGNPNLKPETNNQVDIKFIWKEDKYGKFELSGFYSYIENYITGRLIGNIQPQSKDVFKAGVKEFYNAESANFTGFEFSYYSPKNYKLHIALNAGYTYATISKATKHILNESNDNVIDEIELKNDPLSEIPPFESTLSLAYEHFGGKFLPEFVFRFVAAQNNVSEAFYENKTDGFVVSSLRFSYFHNKSIWISGGVNNLFDIAYYEHLNRRIIGRTANLYEMGRSAFVKLHINI